ncbi:MAG: RluA family pseudouridine synthase [Planctomycetes bacterium]|nr:RluA family pseudouridine synthase [Planctomycetota bacterium]
MSETIVVPRERAGLELDEFLCLHFPEFSKGFLRRAVREGLVTLDGMRANPSQHLREDQVLIVEFDDQVPANVPVAPEASIPVLFEDDDLLVVDKPSGLAVEPERWARSAASLAGALLALARSRSRRDDDEQEDGPLELRLRAVHRLDKDTSGALVVAKNLEAERALRTAFEHDQVHKTYWALVEGEHPLPEGEEQEIDLPIGPDEKRSGRMQVDAAEGKPAQTRISVVQRFHGYTWLACRPLSGRTHQIRVHLSAVGFPLAVDPLYGRRDELRLSHLKAGYKVKRGQSERALVSRLTLHAAVIDVPAPREPACRIRVEAPLPKDLAQLLKQLAKVRAWNP